MSRPETDIARPGEALVCQAAVDASDRPDVDFSELGAGGAEGAAEPIPLWVAQRQA